METKKKLNIENLRVKSFVTSFKDNNEDTVKGGGAWSLYWSCFWCTRK